MEQQKKLLEQSNEHLQWNKLNKQSLLEFKQSIINETLYLNDIKDLKSKDGEYYQIMDRDEQQRQRQRRRNLKEGDMLIAPYQFQLFKFSLLGLPIVGLAEFFCLEGPSGKDSKDLCIFEPIIQFMGLSLGGYQAKVEVQIKKLVKIFNGFRKKVIDKIENITILLDTKLTNISGNSQAIIDEVIKTFTPEENAFTKHIIKTTDSVNNLVSESFGQINNIIDDIVYISDDLIKFPLQNIKANLVSYVFDVIQNSEDIWNSIETDLSDNLYDFKKKIEQSEYVPKQVCYQLNNKLSEFSQYTDNQRKLSENFGYNMLIEKVQEPIVQLLSNTIYLDDESDDENMVDNLKSKLIKEIKNIANNIMSNIIEAPIQEVLKEYTEELDLYGPTYKEQIITVKDSIIDQWNPLLIQCQQKAVDLKEIDGEIEYNILYKYDNLIPLQNYQVDLQNNFNSITQKISLDTLYLYPQIFRDAFVTIKSLKYQILNFHSTFKTNFVSGLKEIKQNVVNLGPNIKKDVKQTVDTIKTNVNELIGEIKTLVPELMQTLKNKNEEGDEYEGEVLDIESLIDQIKNILKIKEVVPKVKGVIESAKTIPDHFKNFNKFVKNFAGNTFNNLKSQKINFSKLKSIDADDLKTFIKPLTSAISGSLNMDIEESLDGVANNQVSLVKNSISNVADTLVDKLKEQLFDKLGNMDELFKKAIVTILDKFQTPEKTLFKKLFLDYDYFQQLLFPTPIGLTLFIEFGISCQAGLDLKFQLKGREVQVKGSLFAESAAHARGGVSLFIILIGVYITALLFSGALTIIIVVGFTSKFYGSLVVSISVEAMKIIAGLYAQYLWFKCKVYCIKLGCFKICIPFIEWYWTDPVDLIDPFIFEGLSFQKDLLKIRF